MAKLKAYRKKRDFGRTPEPAPETPAPSAAWGPHREGEPLRYMIHKHDANRLHYDLRLEMDGALASWAIPKGPSEDPANKRMAVPTEDHPLAYGGFEGRIPDGEYGGGDSLIWDTGVYETVPPGQASAQRRKGHLDLSFQGEKLKGHWHLLRPGKDQPGSDPKVPWLFFKAKDADARPGSDLTAERPESVVSGRRLTRGPERKKDLRAAHPAPEQLLRGFLPPMQASLSSGLPDDPEAYTYELKYDGFRALAALTAGPAGGAPRVALWSRNGLDLGARFAEVVEALRHLVVAEAVIDGEVVALDAKGVPRFELLQDGRHPLIYFAFDLLGLDGQDLRPRPIEERRELLGSLLDGAPPTLQRSLQVTEAPQRFLARAAAQGFEGLVAKRRGSVYTAGRSRVWLKLKVRNEQELAIVGYQPSTAGPRQVGSLLLAHFEKGRLVFAGKVGTGFTTKVRAELYRQLHPDAVPNAAAAAVVGAPRMKAAIWVKPTAVAQVAFQSWTAEGLVRQAAFLGLRPDKRPEETGRE